MGFDARDAGDAGLPPGASISLELPEGGQMRDLAVSPTDGTWYVLSFFGGVFRSTPNGDSWEPCGSVGAAGIEVGADGTLWAAGPDVYASTDQCATWTSTNAPRATLDIGVYGNEVWALGDTRLYQRTGTTWTPQTTPLDGNLFSQFGGVPGTGRVAGTSSAGIVVSADGISWNQKSGIASMNVTDIAASATTLLVYSGNDGSSNGGAACSDAAGNSWTVCYAAGGTALALDPLDPQHVVFANYDDLAETADAFGNVMRGMRALSGMPDATVRDIRYTSGGTLIVASERGVYASTSRPLAFVPKLSGLSAWTIDAILRDGDDLYLSSEAGPLHAKVGEPFQLSGTGLQEATRVDRMAFAPDGTLLAPGRQVWASRDRGASWTRAAQLNLADGYNSNVVTFIGDLAIAGTQTRILRSGPPYTSWSVFAVGSGNVAVRDLVAIDGLLYLATSGGLFVSADSGATSQPVAQVTGSSNEIAVLADGGLAVATAGGLLVSDATRTSWVTQLATIQINDVSADGDRIVAISSFPTGGAAGVVASTDRGASWLTVVTPAGVHVATAAFDSDGSLVLGTYGHGLVRAALP